MKKSFDIIAFEVQCWLTTYAFETASKPHPHTHTHTHAHRYNYVFV